MKVRSDYLRVLVFVASVNGHEMYLPRDPSLREKTRQRGEPWWKEAETSADLPCGRYRGFASIDVMRLQPNKIPLVWRRLITVRMIAILHEYLEEETQPLSASV